MKISNENTLVDYTENSYTVQKSVQSRMRILLNQYGLNEMENSAA